MKKKVRTLESEEIQRTWLKKPPDNIFCDMCGSLDLKSDGKGYWDGYMVEGLICTKCGLKCLGRIDYNDPDWSR